MANSKKWRDGLLGQMEAARSVSVPIIAIRTADQAATAEAIIADETSIAKAAGKKIPIVQWDAARGLGPANDAGKAALAAKNITGADTIGFTEAMLAAAMLPPSSMVLAFNAHRQLTSQEPGATASAVQSVANLRNLFKQDFRALVLLGPLFVIPSELEHDVVTFDHALPTQDDLKVIIKELYASVKPAPPAPSDADLVKMVDAVSGLSAFAAEQVVAMSFSVDGVDIPTLWERKRVMIDQTRGLKVWRGGDRFSDLVGLDSVKTKLTRRKNARTPVGVVVFMDEIDKMLANVEHDTSGVRMDQLLNLLTEMENNEWRGMILVGVPGGGKSAIAKAFGNEAGVPTIALDLGAMEGSLVGESEARVRHALSVIKAVGRGNAYFIATSNNATVMRPELQRRFTDGMFFFDVMTKAERDAAWSFYEKKFDLKKQARPDDDGWTGAEIRNACREAWDTSVSLVEAAKFIVPMASSRADEIERLRQNANGRFLDATKPGKYTYDPEPLARQVRAIQLPTTPMAVDHSGLKNLN